MVIAATTFALGERSIADELPVVSRPPRAAGGHGRRDFYCRPGRELGLHFRATGRKIRTYERRPAGQEFARRVRQIAHFDAGRATGDVKLLGGRRTADTRHATVRCRRITAGWASNEQSCPARTER